MVRTKAPALVAVVAGLAIVLAGCASGSDSGSSSGKKTVSIGATLPLTGNSAAYGKVQREGLTLGLLDASKTLDGVDLKPIFLDDQAQAGPAVTQGTKLMSGNNVAALVTAFSAPPLAQLSIAQQYQVPLLNGGGNTPPLEGHEWLYNSALMITQGASAVMDYAHSDLHADKLSVIIDTGAPSVTNEFYEKYWKKLAGTDPNVVSMPLDADDAGPYVAKAMSTNPDALFVEANSNAMTQALAAIQRAGLTIPILNQDGSFKQSTNYTQLSQSVYYALPAAGTSPQLASAYKKAYGDDPNVFAVQMYNIGLIIGQAAAQLQKEKKDITGPNLQKVLSSADFSFTLDGGIHGGFNKDHIIPQKVTITKWVNGSDTAVKKNVTAG